MNTFILELDVIFQRKVWYWVSWLFKVLKKKRGGGGSGGTNCIILLHFQEYLEA